MSSLDEFMENHQDIIDYPQDFVNEIETISSKLKESNELEIIASFHNSLIQMHKNEVEMDYHSSWAEEETRKLDEINKSFMSKMFKKKEMERLKKRILVFNAHEEDVKNALSEEIEKVRGIIGNLSMHPNHELLKRFIKEIAIYLEREDLVSKFDTGKYDEETIWIVLSYIYPMNAKTHFVNIDELKENISYLDDEILYSKQKRI